MSIRPCTAALGVLLFARGALAQTAPAWPDSFVGRLEALALIEQLNGDLLASQSATATLESWCADHHMASPPRLAAILDRKLDKPATQQDLNSLEVGPGEQIRYRHVRLTCGTHVLSEADNWYVASRLAPDMNRQLETTDTPFGRVVQDLHPVRQTLSVERLWSPLPQGWEMSLRGAGDGDATNGELAIAPFLFRHRSILFDAQHRPIAIVVERYTGEALHYSH